MAGVSWELRESFYELNHRLVQCYEADILAMQEEVQRLSDLLPLPSSKTLPAVPVTAPMQPRSSTGPSVPTATPRFQPRMGTGQSRAGRTLGPPLPEGEVQILDFGMQAGGLWQSEAFQEDLQACMIQKRQMDLVLSQMSDRDRSPAPCAGEKSETAQQSSGEGSDDATATARTKEKFFRPRAFWLETEAENEEARVRNRVAAQAKRPSIQTAASLSDVLAPQAQSSCSACFHKLQHPGSWIRAWWDTFGMLLLTYDVVVIPLRVFDINESVALEVMFWVAHIYWNLAIPVSFVTGYEVEGILVMDLKKTIRNYAFSWFPFDLALVSLDWFLVAAGDGGSAGVARLSRTARSLRFLRLFRLGRVAKVGSLITSLQDQLTSRVANIQYSIFKLLLQLLLCNHIIACLWFLIGDQDADADEDPRDSWLVVSQLKKRSVSYQYFTSLHWAYAQLGVDQSEIEAVNLQERIFSVIISIVALINFSTMVSSMTSLLASLQKLKNDELEQFSLLRRYLRYNNITPDLSHRVTRFLQHTFDLKHRAISKDVQIPILDMLSKPLQDELQLQRHVESFNENEFLRKLLENMDDLIHRVVCDVATNCLTHVVLALDDVVFAAGSVATAAYFISDGQCHYDCQAYPKSVKLCNLWVAEICLWAPWIHLGHLVSQDISRLFILEVTKFAECIGKDQKSRKLAMQHAREVVSRLEGPHHFSDLPWKSRQVDPSRAGTDTETTAVKLGSRWFPCGRVGQQGFSKVVPDRD
eukprot:s1144_g11.t1